MLTVDMSFDLCIKTYWRYTEIFIKNKGKCCAKIFPKLNIQEDAKEYYSYDSWILISFMTGHSSSVEYHLINIHETNHHYVNMSQTI